MSFVLNVGSIAMLIVLRATGRLQRKGPELQLFGKQQNYTFLQQRPKESHKLLLGPKNRGPNLWDPKQLESFQCSAYKILGFQHEKLLKIVTSLRI